MTTCKVYANEVPNIYFHNTHQIKLWWGPGKNETQRETTKEKVGACVCYNVKKKLFKHFSYKTDFHFRSSVP